MGRKNIGRAITRAFKKIPSVVKKIGNELKNPRTLRKISDGVQKYVPVADRVGKGMVLAGTVTGQPEIAALGTGVSAGANAVGQANNAIRPLMFR